MRNPIRGVLAPVCWLILGPLLGLAATIAPAAPARAEPIDRARFAAVLDEARAYALERTLLFYCLRQNADARLFVYLLLHGDIDDALKKLRAAGSDPRQNAVLVETVLTGIRFATPESKDPTLDPQCAGRDFVQELDFLKGAGTPLVMRPALRALASP